MSKNIVVVSISEILYFVGPIVAQYCFWYFFIIQRYFRRMDEPGKIMMPIVFTMIGTIAFHIALSYNWIIKW